MSDPSPPETLERERRLEEILAAGLAAEDAGQPPMWEVLLTQNADLADELKAFLGDYDRVRVLAAPLRAVAFTGTAAGETTECLGATVELATGLADDAHAGAGTIPNAAVKPTAIESGIRVRYFGDYELLNVLGRGGMGVVYKARQISLNRPVALKMLQAGVLATDDDLRRFQNEAEAVAMLDHSHIVPILEVGHHADQRYFSMKLIGGPSLDRELSKFIDNPKAAARLVMTAAEAVHHAHLRGILHRDLKPANVLLDERGEPHVTDFGLAKRVHADSDLTQSGAILGTPRYMAPEQASGKRGMVTTATDVYGLGAILYALLAGRAPFRSDCPLETLEQVRELMPDPPSKHNSRIPRDLEVICLKCLEKQPEMRYTSAQAVAEDLRRYLSSEAILARPVGLATRAWMWCERNPALARLWFALMLTLFLFLATWGGIAIVVIEGAGRREAAAREQAETNFDMAQNAVEDYLTSVSENTLLKEQDTVDIRSLRQDLLKSALVYYQRFAAQRREDPALRKQLAKAYFQVGQITKEIGSSQDAIGAFRSAQSIWEPLVKADPKQHELEGYIAECDLSIGRLQIATSNLEEALNSLTHARAMLERLATENPQEASYQASLADCYSELAIIDAKLEQSRQGMVLLEKSRDIRQRLIERYPNKLDYQKSLAETINVVGWTQYKQHDHAAALKSFREVQDICLAISRKAIVGPKPIWLLNLLSLSQYNIGSIHKTNGELGKALTAFEQSLGYRSALADSHPSVAQFQVNLGMSYREIAEVQRGAHEDDKAFRSIQRSIDVFDGLVRAQPEQASYHSELGLSWNYLGVLYDNGAKNAEAIRPFERAVNEQQLAVAKSKDADDYKKYLYNHLENLGMQYVGLGRVAEGLPHYRRALRIRRQLSAAQPRNREYALEVAKALVALGTIRRHEGEPVSAAQLFSDARTLLENRLGNAPGDPALQSELAVALHNEANALTDRAKSNDARARLEHAVDLFRQGASRASSDVEAILEREARSEALWDLARLLRALGFPAEANRADAERTEIWKGRPPGELATLALKQASRALLIGHGKTPVSAPAKAIRELDLDQAADGLKFAISCGFKDLRMLRSDPDSAILLARDDLKPLIKGLESSGQVSGTPQ